MPCHAYQCKRGEELPHARLTSAQVAAIRRAHGRKQRLIDRLNERYSAAALAGRYGVSLRTVERVLARETWFHVRDRGQQ
jgi:hypothetical protein